MLLRVTEVSPRGSLALGHAETENGDQQFTFYGDHRPMAALACALAAGEAVFVNSGEVFMLTEA